MKTKIILLSLIVALFTPGVEALIPYPVTLDSTGCTNVNPIVGIPFGNWTASSNTCTVTTVQPIINPTPSIYLLILNIPVNTNLLIESTGYVLIGSGARINNSGNIINSGTLNISLGVSLENMLPNSTIQNNGNMIFMGYNDVTNNGYFNDCGLIINGTNVGYYGNPIQHSCGIPPVPELSTAALLGVGILGLAIVLRKKKYIQETH